MTSKALQITGIIAATIIVVALIGVYTVFQLAPTSSNTVSAQGVSKISVQPDLVTVYFSVETNGSTAKEAKDKNQKISEDLVTALIKAGFERKDIQTENFNVYPDYSWENGKQKQLGYRATHSIKVELSTDDTERISEVIDAGVDAGANLNYINFELSTEKQNEYKTDALRSATQDARIKAESIAQGLGKSLGSLVSVSSSSFEYYPWNVYTRSAGGAEDLAVAKSSVSSIQPGDKDIQASVYVVYKLR